MNVVLVLIVGAILLWAIFWIIRDIYFREGPVGTFIGIVAGLYTLFSLFPLVPAMLVVIIVILLHNRETQA